MKEGVKKSISLILVLTLLVQLLPMVAFGVGDETNDLDISTDSETVSMKDDDAEIVGEEDALREESVKHFRLQDGGYMLVEYETAVHYQTASRSTRSRHRIWRMPTAQRHWRTPPTSSSASRAVIC